MQTMLNRLEKVSTKSVTKVRIPSVSVTNMTWSATEAITEAEAILPGIPGSDPNNDPRWQAIIHVAEFVESDPEPLWQFARRWGASSDDDLRQAIASCLLEHLLEYHFDLIFPRVVEASRADRYFADTFLGCWEFGQTELPTNREQFDALKVELRTVAR